jgi:branched-chain amino acid transport system permease protein
MLQAILVYGFVWAALYTLMALGFSLIFSVAKILNLAHGMLIMAACYIVYIMTASLHLPLISSVLLGTFSVVLLGLFLYIGFMKKLRGSVNSLVLLTSGLAMIIQEVIIITIGPTNKFVPSLVKGSISILGVEVSYQQILSVIAAYLFTGLVWFLLYRTRLGRAIRAVAQDRDTAAMSGINAEQIFMVTMGISAALAAIAGVLIAPLQTVTPEIGWGMLGPAFTVTILGGIGSVWGIAIAGFIVAYVEMVTAFAISPALKEAAAFLILALTLMFRPSGLFGKGEIE